MDPEARYRMVMRVIDHYAAAVASAAVEDSRSITDPPRSGDHRAAARGAEERAASIRVEVDQIVRGLLGLPQA